MQLVRRRNDLEKDAGRTARSGKCGVYFVVIGTNLNYIAGWVSQRVWAVTGWAGPGQWSRTPATHHSRCGSVHAINLRAGHHGDIQMAWNLTAVSD